MARTAPAPDLPPIPGMCPSIAVLAGGGDMGSGGGDGAGGGDGNNNAGAGGGADGAGGDGKGAQSGSGGCGGAGGGGCPGHHARGGGGGSVSRGDPVDVVTGRVFTLPKIDLALPGPLPLEIVRTYSSSAHDRDVGIGFGWSHSLAWEVEVQRRNVRVLCGDGTSLDFGDVPVGKGALAQGGWILLREAWGFVLDTSDGRYLAFSAAEHEGRRYRLTAIEDRRRNRVALTYEDGRLVEIVDSVGRVARVKSTRAGRIESIEVKNAIAQGSWIPFARYAYDDAGDLVAVTDADGHTWRYAYADHLLVEHVDPTGLTYHFRYDEKRRCVETWGDYPGREDPSLADGVPARLADHTTRAKGVHHCVLEYHADGYSEVVDSVKVQRFQGNAFGKIDKAVSAAGVFTRAYDDLGFELSYTDPLGATTRWERDARGRILRIVDPLDRVTLIERDDDGQITQVADPLGGVTAVTSDGDRTTIVDAVGAVTGIVVDARGLVTETIAPSGARTRYQHDVHGNTVRALYDDGTTEEMTYDALGRMLSYKDARGAVTSYAYSARGDLVAARDPAGGITRYAYDGAGELVEVVFPDGRSTSVVRGGHHRVCELRQPSGEVLSFRYDREGQLVEVHNAEGEVHRLVRSAAGHVIEETTFDGRTLRYRHDLVGRPIRFDDGLGRKIELEYDLAGQLVARRYPDGAEETFAYDLRGELVAARGPGGEILLERDAVGDIVREIQTIGGESHEVVTAYDPMRRAVRRATSLGHVEEIERDGYGRCRRVRLGPGQEIAIESDAVGQEIRRVLPRGGVIETTFDELCRVVRRRVLGPAAPPRTGPAEPAWIGPQPGDAKADRAYRYSPTGELLERWDAARGATRFEHDPLGRLLSALPESARGELYRYDDAGALHELTPGAPAREYGPGNRIVRRGGTEYTWSANGQLREARTRDPATGRESVRKLAWSGSGLLERVDEPDGTVIELAYDPFARRLGKKVTRRRGPGLPPEVTFTRFVWSGDQLVHEIRREASAAGDPIVAERTYCFEDDGLRPLAHRDVERRGDEAIRSGDWLHYVTDPIGAPERLIAGDGAVISEIELTPWGKGEGPGAAATPLRFPGQYEDAETGLSYNHHRYYDPVLGRYISADPVGLLGGLDAFAYADNRPTDRADPFGLFPTARIVDNRPGGRQRTYNGNSGTTNPLDGAIDRPLSTAQRQQAGATASGGRCAEVDALNQMAADVRSDLRGANRGQEPTDRQVRREMARRFQSGEATIEASGTSGPMAPCPCCGQLYYNMGIATEANAAAGAVPGVRIGNQAWDGRSSQIQQNGRPRNWRPAR